MSEGLSLSARIAAAYKLVTASGKTLDVASDELAKQICQVDTALQKHKIRLVTWERIQGTDDSYGNYQSVDVGYLRVNGTWGLAIREESGNHNWGGEPELEVWPFNEAPPSYRIEALDKIPDLLERLAKVADKTAKKLHEKTADARKLVDGILQAQNELTQPQAPVVVSGPDWA